MSDDTVAPFLFPAISRKKVVAAFDGGRFTSDGGVMLLVSRCRVGIDRPGMVAVGCHDVAPPLFWLQIVLPHQTAQLLTVHHLALVAQRRPALR
jgi:hypothetical protein